MIGKIKPERHDQVCDAYDAGRACGDAMLWAFEREQVADAQRCPDFHAPLMGGLNRQDADDTRSAFLYGYQVSIAHGLLGMGRKLDLAEQELAHLRGEVQ